MERTKNDKKASEQKRRQIFKPLLSNPYTPRQKWIKIDHADQSLVLECLTKQVLSPMGRWNLLSKEDQAKEVERENADPNYTLFKDRLLITLGYNSIMKKLEDRVQNNMRDNDHGESGVLFVSKGDMATPLLYHHLPMLCALAGVKLIQLPKNSSAKIAQSVNSITDVSIIFIDDKLIAQNKSLHDIMSSVELVNAGIMDDLKSTKLDMKVKFLLTDAPIKKR